MRFKISKSIPILYQAPRNPILLGRAGLWGCRVALASGVRWRDERIFAILEHADGKAVHETLGGSVEVAERGVAPPPPNDPDSVRVDS